MFLIPHSSERFYCVCVVFLWGLLQIDCRGMEYRGGGAAVYLSPSIGLPDFHLRVGDGGIWGMGAVNLTDNLHLFTAFTKTVQIFHDRCMGNIKRAQLIRLRGGDLLPKNYHCACKQAKQHSVLHHDLLCMSNSIIKYRDETRIVLSTHRGI